MPTNTNIDSGGAIVGTTNYVYHSDGTVTSDLKNCTQKDKNYTYNPCSGMNFSNADDICYTVDGKKELYLYQQFYYNSYGYILFYSATKNCGVRIKTYNMCWYTKGVDHDNVSHVSDGLHSFKMHVITDTDTTKNVMQIWLDGKLVYDGNNVSYLDGEPITGVEFFSGADNRNSNIIISESDITADDVTKLFPADKVGLVFDGKTASVQLPLSASAGKKVWTISTTLSTTQNTSTSTYNYHQPCLIGIDTAGAASDDFHIDTKNGNLFLFNGMSSSDTGTDTGIKISDELQHNIVLTSDGTKFVLYCDGKKVTESAITKTMNSSCPITIGCSKPGECVYSQLTLYDFKFYDICLTDGKATTEKPIVDYEPDTVDFSNKYLTDKSGNGNNSQAFSGTITSVDANIVTTINNYDIARKVSNADYNYYRWETLGDGSQFDVHDSYTTSNDANYSKTGIAFNAGDNSTLQKNLPNLNEVWLKFDYFNGTYYRWVQVFFNDDKNIGMHGTDDDTFFNFFGHEFSGIDGINTVLMHISRTTNTAELWINGIKVISDISITLTDPITKVSMSPSGWSGNYASMTNNWMSNIIISDVEIGLDEIAKGNTPLVTINADIARKVSAELVNVYDISRTLKDNTNAIILNADISRKTNIDEIANYDMQNYSICDTELAVTTQRITSNCFTTTEDIVRNVVYGAKLEVDTQRTKHIVTVNNADTRISIPSIMTDQSSGLQSVNINMSQSQLSDSIRIVTINPVDINGAVIGNFLDYKLNMRAETTSQKGILQEITCMTDKDEILYKKIVYSGYDDDSTVKIYHGKRIYDEKVANTSEILSYMKLSKHMNKIANVLGCNLVMCSDDFISTCSLNDSGATYQSIISELCGWTSKLPNMFINAFIRGNTLYVIQRGHEPNSINIDNLKMTEPTIAKKLIRTEWNNAQSTSGGGNGAGTIGAHFPDDEKDDGDGSDVDKQEPRVETSSDTRYSDDGGYSVTETQRTYEEIGALHGAVMISHETEKCTAYSAENPASTTIEDGVEVYRGASRDITVTLTETYHNYDSYGWHTVTTVTTVDGVLKETHSSKSLGSTEGVTSFRVHAANDTKKDSTTINSGDDVNNYNSLVDSDFPVYGDYLTTCKSNIKWLNRKVQETVTLSIYDYTHIFDFQDKIVYKGNTYSIQSNNFEKNATIVNKQDLVLIRFY